MIGILNKGGDVRRAKIKYEIVRHDKFRYFMISGSLINALSYLKLLNFGMILMEKLNENLKI